MKLTYQVPAIDTTKFAPEILDGPYHTSAGTKGAVTGGSNSDENPTWGFGGNGDTNQSVDSKQNLWDDWDE